MPSNFHLRQAAFRLLKGGIIAYPSDTIAALGALPIFPNRLNQLLGYKKRSWHKGLILLASQFEQLEDFVKDEDLAKLKKKVNLTHPTTFLLEPNPNLAPSLSYYLLGSNPKLAVRITKHPKINYLCDRLGLPIVSTSLNKANQRTLETNYQVKKQFPKLDYYLTIQKTNQASSRIIDLASGIIIR